MITKEKAGRLKKFRRTAHPKNGIIALLSIYWRNSEKLVQWIGDIAQGGLAMLLRKKAWIW